MIHMIRGDILTDINPNQKTLIMHGCNCFHTMGAGIAKYLKQKFPVILQIDKATGYGDKGKLGTFSTAVISENLRVLNCYTQYDYRRVKSRANVDYIAIEECFKEIKRLYDPTWEIRMPKIGCGLAGGDWNTVGICAFTIFRDHSLKIYYL